LAVPPDRVTLPDADKVVKAPLSGVDDPMAVASIVLAEPVTTRVPATLNVFPDPTFKPTEVPFPAAAKTASMLSKSVLSFPPHESVEAPTSGLVRRRFVVVESAMIKLHQVP
jgi:hypothetical protein